MKQAILVIVTALMLTACSSPGTNTIPETSFPLKAYVETADEAVDVINKFYSKYLLSPNF